MTPASQVEPDTTMVNEMLPVGAVNENPADTIVQDDFGIEEQIFYDSDDSTVMDIETETVYLYGNAVVKYGNRELSAAFISYSFENNQAYAHGVMDTAGVWQGRPVFKDNDMEFEQDSLAYNFRSSKGVSYGVLTRQGDAYLHSTVSKRHDNGWVHVGGGKFTTCDKPKPHYHFRLSKAIVIPNDKVVSGPLYMKVGNVPTPLALPFGFFPSKRESAHGIILPGYGNAQERGYFLKGMGYYIPFPPYADTKFLFDVYSRGSWRVENHTGYKKIYKFNGNVKLSRAITVDGFPELAGYSKRTDFNVQWNHRQDAKAKPNRQFSANVNLGTSDNFRNTLSTVDEYLTSTLNSAIRWSRTWNDRPFLLDVSARHAQNTQTKTVDVVLPSVNFGMNRVNLPLGFLGGTPSKKQKLNSKIGVNYSAQMENAVTAGDSLFVLNKTGELWRRSRNGIKHSASSSTSFKLLQGAVTLNPSASYSEFWSFKKLDVHYANENDTATFDTIPGFATARNWNAGVSASTRLYGVYNFKKGETIKALRHVMNFSSGVNYVPYFNYDNYGYYGDDGQLVTYSDFDVARFVPSNTRQAGNLNFSLNQNLEAKIRDRSSAKLLYNKVSLIDGFRTGISRNLMADSLNWSNFSMSAFTTLLNKFRINYNSSYSLYDRDSTGREINQYLSKTQGRLMRMETTSGTLGFDLAGGKGNANEQDPNEPPGEEGEEENFVPENYEQRVNNVQIPWFIRVNYNVSLRNEFDTETQQDHREISGHSVSIQGSITIKERWQLGLYSGYDLVAKKQTLTSLNFYWDLHCWEFKASWTPFGGQRNYTVQLNIKSGLLRDLKLEQRRSYEALN